MNNKFISFKTAKLIENIIFTKIKLNLIFLKTFFSCLGKRKKGIIFFLFHFDTLLIRCPSNSIILREWQADLFFLILGHLAFFAKKELL